jgi:hypothetical protein
MPFPKAVAVGLIVSLSFGIAACGGSDDADGSAGPVESDNDLLALEASIVGGGDYSLEQHAGEDLVLWFWAPW